MSGMPGSPDHKVFDELAVGWALHALEPEDETAFARHLPDCPRCSRTVAETVEVMAALATDLPPAEPSDALRSRLRAAVRQTEQIGRPAVVPGAAPGTSAPLRDGRRSDDGAAAHSLPPRSRFSSLRERGGALALAAALAAVVGLGIWNVSLAADRDRAAQAAAEQRAVVEELLQPGAEVVARLADGSGPVASVVVRDGDVEVVSEALPVNDDTDETYVLWGLRDDSPEPEAIGAFDVVRSRLDLHAVGSAPTGSRAYDGYAVSLEPGRQPPTTPSEVLATGQVTS